MQRKVNKTTLYSIETLQLSSTNNYAKKYYIIK